MSGRYCVKATTFPPDVILLSEPVTAGQLLIGGRRWTGDGLPDGIALTDGDAGQYIAVERNAVYIEFEPSEDHP